MNYPPGVSGNEYAIAGPDHEKELDAYCLTCDSKQPGTEQGYGFQRWFICETCGETTELDDIAPEDDYNGPDTWAEYYE